MSKLKRSILRFSLALILLSFILPLVGCGAEDLDKSLTRILSASRGARRVVTSLYNNGQLAGDPEAARQSYRAKLSAFRSFNEALDGIADDVVALGKVTPENKSAVLPKLKKLIDDFRTQLGAGNLGVKNEASKKEYASKIALVEGLLQGIYNAIEAIKTPVEVDKLQIKSAQRMIRGELEQLDSVALGEGMIGDSAGYGFAPSIVLDVSPRWPIRRIIYNSAE